MRKGIVTLLISVLLSGLTAWAVVKASEPSEIGEPGAAGLMDAAGQSVRTVNLSLSDYPDFTYAAEHSVEAVVYIEVKVQARAQQYQMDPFLDFFFGQGQSSPRYRERRGSGSGVIIRPDGYIATANHVVADASEVTVTLNNNKTYTAKVVGTDPATDVALIKIDAEGLPFLEFADSDKLRLGEWVLAIGSPLGRELQSTITAGIVSAKGRSMPGENGEFKIESFIQTDAAVNPGNSGGALVNKQGELVGINTAIVSQTGAYSGYSFAVPSNIVAKIISDLIDFGTVNRVMLGIKGGTVNEDIAGKLKLSETSGVYVSEAVKGGAADKAGIKAEDVIVAVDSTKIGTMPELQAKINNYHPGDKANVRIIRDGRMQNLQVEFSGTAAETGAVTDDGTIAFYGARLKAVENGVLIVSAGNGKVAQAGGEDGFVIQYVNDQKVSKPQDVVDAAKKGKRSIFIEGVTASGRPGYFGFGKE